MIEPTLVGTTVIDRYQDLWTLRDDGLWHVDAKYQVSVSRTWAQLEYNYGPIEPSSHWSDVSHQILNDVLEERMRQVARYGHNDECEWGNGPETRWLLPYTRLSAVEIERDLRNDYEEFEEETGAPTRAHLLREELAEALAEGDPDKLEVELIQVAALAVAWVEAIRRSRS